MHISTGPAIVLRKDKFEEQARKNGIEGDRGWADLLGVAQTTVMRLFTGETRPGNAFIARTLTALPEAGFYDLFEVAA
jgi:hypothetical protein